MLIRHYSHPIRGTLTTEIRNLSQQRLHPDRAQATVSAMAKAEELGQAVAAAMVQEMVAILVAVIGAKVAVVPVAVAAVLITIRSLVARTSLVRRESWKSPSLLTPRQLAKIRLRAR